jgi:hypothetical protein
MAKAKTTNIKSKKAPLSLFRISLTSKNYMIIGLGILLIIIGYILMGTSSVDGFVPTVLSPILLVIGYCVIIPFGILYKDKGIIDDTTEMKTISEEKNDSPKMTASNVKTI